MKKNICALFVLFMLVSPIKGNETKRNIKFSDINHKIQLYNYWDTIDRSATYYWYYIRPERRINKHSKNIEIKVCFSNIKISSGTMFEYEKSLWKSRLSGYKIAIGPFQSLAEAQNSLFYYKVSSIGSDTMLNSSDKELYWYKFEFGITKKTHQLMIIPDYNTQKGNNVKFVKELKPSIQNNTLFQGPWINYQLCEELKPKPRGCTFD